MTRFHSMPLLLAAIAALGHGFAAADFDDFQSFTPNISVNGQGEWTVEDSFGNSAELFDEEIVDDGGNHVWRFSNAITSGSLSNQPNSSRPDQVAGETGAGLYNDYGMDHTMPNNPPLSSATATTPYFRVGMDFKSATGAAQPGLGINFSPSATQSTLRNSYIRIEDSGSGLDLEFFDTTGSNFNGTTIATGLSYTDWHSIDMFVEFVDGIGPGPPGDEMGNDIVTIVLNGSIIHTGTTWESYFYNNVDSGPAGVPRASNSVVFQARGTAAPDTLGEGLYFDNVNVDNARIPEPSTLVLGALLGTAACLLRRRAR